MQKCFLALSCSPVNTFGVFFSASHHNSLLVLQYHIVLRHYTIERLRGVQLDDLMYACCHHCVHFTTVLVNSMLITCLRLLHLCVNASSKNQALFTVVFIPKFCFGGYKKFNFKISCNLTHLNFVWPHNEWMLWPHNEWMLWPHYSTNSNW